MGRVLNNIYIETNDALMIIEGYAITNRIVMIDVENRDNPTGFRLMFASKPFHPLPEEHEFPAYASFDVKSSAATSIFEGDFIAAIERRILPKHSS